MKFEWENIDQYHKRAKVIGGWLVKAYEDMGGSEYPSRVGYEWRIALTFVPDNGHYWKVS